MQAKVEIIFPTLSLLRFPAGYEIEVPTEAIFLNDDGERDEEITSGTNGIANKDVLLLLPANLKFQLPKYSEIIKPRRDFGIPLPNKNEAKLEQDVTLLLERRFCENQTLSIPEGTELVGKKGYALDHEDEDDRNQKVFLKIPAAKFVVFPEGTSIRIRDSLFYITMFSGTTVRFTKEVRYLLRKDKVDVNLENKTIRIKAPLFNLIRTEAFMRSIRVFSRRNVEMKTYTQNLKGSQPSNSDVKRLRESSRWVIDWELETESAHSETIEGDSEEEFLRELEQREGLLSEEDLKLENSEPCYLIELEPENSKMSRRSQKSQKQTFPFPQVCQPELRAFEERLRNLRLDFLLWEWQMCLPACALDIVEGKRFENSLRANYNEWTIQHWETVLGPFRGTPGGHTFDTKFKINNANMARIANKFAAKKSRTNGFPVQFLKDPFERTVVMAIMALFRPYRTTYMTAHQVVLLEHMLSPTGRVDWAEIFHNFVRDSINFCLGDDSGTHYFLVFVGHFYIGLNLLDDEKRKYMKSHYPTEEKLKDVVWIRRQKAMEERIRVFAETGETGLRVLEKDRMPMNEGTPAKKRQRVEAAERGAPTITLEDSDESEKTEKGEPLPDIEEVNQVPRPPSVSDTNTQAIPQNEEEAGPSNKGKEPVTEPQEEVAEVQPPTVNPEPNEDTDRVSARRTPRPSENSPIVTHVEGARAPVDLDRIVQVTTFFDDIADGIGSELMPAFRIARRIGHQVMGGEWGQVGCYPAMMEKLYKTWIGCEQELVRLRVEAAGLPEQLKYSQDLLSSKEDKCRTLRVEKSRITAELSKEKLARTVAESERRDLSKRLQATRHQLTKSSQRIKELEGADAQRSVQIGELIQVLKESAEQAAQGRLDSEEL
ncbi:hypothetical protein R1sor_020954 [Riccia sorocarpa]|uniref:Uncharacterized protein n=1 Tax=Riccia sorocarpa TaxID=122646 RepID=A0ABD3GFN5_9MARC